MKAEPMDRVQFDGGKIMRDHPPQWNHPNKQAVFALICSTNDPFAGRIVYARWSEEGLPQIVTPSELDSLGIFRVQAGI